MKKTWSIKTMTMMVSGGLALSMIVILTIVIYAFVTKGFTNLEITFADKNIERANKSFEYIVDNYNRKLADWAQWDDTYKFIKDLNGDYISSNLVETTLINLNVEEMLFFDQSGKLKYATASAETTKREKMFPEDVENLIIGNKKIADDLSLNQISSGLVKTEDGIALYAAHSITKSDGTNPGRGSLVFIRYIGPWLGDEMSALIQLPIILETDQAKVSVKDKPIVFDVKNNKIYGHFLLPVANSSDRVGLQFEMNREIWTEGVKTMNYLLLTTGVLAITCAFSVYLFLYQTVLKDLIDFQKEVAEITKQSGIGQTQKKGKSLEMDELRGNINLLIDVVNKSKEQTESKIIELDKMNKLMIGRELKMVELKKEIEKATKK